MAQNLQMDPVARDYVLLNGSPIPSDRVEESGYFALAIPQDKWVHGVAGQGSLLYSLQNVKRSGAIEQQYAAYALDAINSQVVSTGKAKAVQVQNIAASRTGSSNKIEIIPASTQLSAQLNFISV